MGLRTVYPHSLGLWKKVLGDDEVNNNLVMYLDDLIVHSSTFSDHLQLWCKIRNGESDACKEEVDVQMRRYEKEGTAEEDR